MKRTAVFALLLLAAPAFADTPEPPQAAAPSVKLPPTLTTKVGAWVLIPADVSGGVPQWYLPDGKKADKTRALHMREAVPGEGLAEVPLESIFGEDWARKAQGRVFTSNVPGVFRVCAYNARGDMASLISTCVVTVEGPAPPPGPAPPGPTPGPTPPGPAPTPGDPLAATLAAAYKADGSPAAQAKALASLYRLGSTSTVNDPALATLDALVAVMHKAADSLMPPPTTGPRPLAQTRDAIKADLAAKVGTKPGTPLDATLRKTLADAFTRYAALLDSVSK
jgi:hypothetical protein